MRKHLHSLIVTGVITVFAFSTGRTQESARSSDFFCELIFVKIPFEDYVQLKTAKGDEKSSELDSSRKISELIGSPATVVLERILHPISFGEVTRSGAVKKVEFRDNKPGAPNPTQSSRNIGTALFVDAANGRTRDQLNLKILFECVHFQPQPAKQSRKTTSKVLSYIPTFHTYKLQSATTARVNEWICLAVKRYYPVDDNVYITFLQLRKHSL